MSGELFVPTRIMANGGSSKTRGSSSPPATSFKSSSSIPSSSKKKGGINEKRTESLYPPRFVSYLSRFLLTNDPAAKAWWISTLQFNSGSSLSKDDLFAAFSNSVELGLSDYFSGPYGSYSSVAAAKAGVNSAETKKSSIAREENGRRQGVLNLFALLRERYRGNEEKLQLAILFSLLDGEDLPQPTLEIASLLGEADDAGFRLITLLDDISYGGYSLDRPPPRVIFSDPPAVGSLYLQPNATVFLKPTGRLIKINVLDSGFGYDTPPKVKLITGGEVKEVAEAEAVLNPDSSVAEIKLANRGRGYSSRVIVDIAPPTRGSGGRRATASVEFEGRVSDISLLSSGSGYTESFPSKAYLQNPLECGGEAVDGLVRYRTNVVIVPRMAEKRVENGSQKVMLPSYSLPDSSILSQILKDPTKTLPTSSFRPVYDSETKKFVIPGLPKLEGREEISKDSRGSVFGSIGKAPVTMAAVRLSPDEYGKLVAAGGIATILVRMGLIPLDVIKTKIQLKDDDELFKQIVSPVSTVSVGKGIFKLRGPAALFQSADVTFLASVIYGTIGFGATELFRRSFALAFHPDSISTDNGDYFTILLAAAAACIVTSGVVAPLENLRIKAMSVNDRRKVGFGKVLKRTLDEIDGIGENESESESESEGSETASWTDIKLRHVPPLWSSFVPICFRELPFGVAKFAFFELFANFITGSGINDKLGGASLGIGFVGLGESALAGSLAGVCAAVISHPADVVTTLIGCDPQNRGFSEIFQEQIKKEGGVRNLFVGLQQRAVFFFFVIGIQFLLYDAFKGVLGVASDDLSLVLDVFYAVRQGLVQ